MNESPATFQDSLGREDTTLHIEGTTLTLELRGIPFSGPDFDALSPARPLSAAERTLFLLDPHDDCLCSCSISWVMPLQLRVDSQVETAQLHSLLELGDPRPTGGITREILTLRLVSTLGELHSPGTSGWFEDELLVLRDRCRPRGRLECCLTCAWSDYNPAGHGLWGGLACFRDCKDDYSAVRSKHNLFTLWERMTEYVAETYLCPAYSQRQPGTGYRG